MGSKKEKDLFELFYRDRVKYTWKNLGEHAQGMYDTPQDAIDILAKYSSLLRKAAPGTYPIYDLSSHLTLEHPNYLPLLHNYLWPKNVLKSGYIYTLIQPI